MYSKNIKWNINYSTELQMLKASKKEYQDLCKNVYAVVLEDHLNNLGIK